VELNGNSGSFILYKQGNESQYVDVRLNRIEETDENSSAYEAITSFSGLPWMQVENPNCNGQGTDTQSNCLQISANTQYTVDEEVNGTTVERMVSFGWDVFIFGEDSRFDNGQEQISVGAGNVKFNLRLGDEAGLNGWPGMPGNTVDFIFDIDAHKVDSNENGPFIDYLTYVNQCCCGVCSNNDQVNITTANNGRDTVSFPTCDNSDCATTLLYDPVVGLVRSEDSGSSEFPIVVVGVVVGALAILALFYCMCCRRKPPANNDGFSALLSEP
jgi:hypothetical protein